MSSKNTEKDEVAALMQQQGISRVQATKMLYEMAKQKRKDEAASKLGPKMTVPTSQVINNFMFSVFRSR